MPEFKDISEFEEIQPTGNEKIQVSASGCVNLLTLVEVLGKKTSWYGTITEQIKSLTSSVSTVQKNVNNLNTSVTDLTSSLTKTDNKVSIHDSQIKAINSRYLLTPTYQVVTEEVEEQKVKGNTVLCLNNSQWSKDTTIILDKTDWGAGVGALSVNGFIGPNFSNSRVLSRKPLKFSTNNNRPFIMGNVNQIDLEVTSGFSYGIFVYDISLVRTEENAEPAIMAYDFMVVGKIITSNYIEDSEFN